MTFTITEGMDGKKVETIGKYSSNEIDKMNSDFEKWKNSKKTKKKYRVQWYDRILIRPNDRKMIIDFGDYSYFGLIKANKSDWKALEEYKSKQYVELEV